MKRIGLRQVVNLLAVLLMVGVNGLANALPLNGQLTGEISDRFQVYFVPAGYVFGIWGVIYLGLLAFVIYQLLPAQRDNPRLARIGGWFALSCVANTLWIFLWHYEYFAATVLVMLVLLVSLLAIYLRLGIGRVPVARSEKWLVDIPFGIYLGWITVATVANITDWLYVRGWSGAPLSPQLWAVIMLLVAAVLGILMSLLRRDLAYVLVLVWAFVGIYVKQATAPMVAWTAVILAAVLALVGVYNLLRPGVRA